MGKTTPNVLLLSKLFPFPIILLILFFVLLTASRNILTTCVPTDKKKGGATYNSQRPTRISYYYEGRGLQKKKTKL